MESYNSQVSGAPRQLRRTILKSSETLELQFAGPRRLPRPANCNSKVSGDFRVASLKSSETLELRLAGLGGPQRPTHFERPFSPRGVQLQRDQGNSRDHSSRETTKLARPTAPEHQPQHPTHRSCCRGSSRSRSSPLEPPPRRRSLGSGRLWEAAACGVCFTHLVLLCCLVLAVGEPFVSCLRHDVVSDAPN